ncbi:MAG: GGDEF domain-containing protein, partial [Rubrivivax sp.]|nr:GGDEF domain-containing protein [Pyrinomonadaceae bacterium]
VVIRSEIEKAEREAEIYRLRNIELAQAAEELRIANEQKGELVAQLQEQREALERETREDFLTGLNNRRHADAMLAQEFNRARRFGRDFTVAMLDIDNFKAVNDRFSHHTGDEVIRGVAQILRETCREIDLVARYGGEEFVLGLIETPASKAAVLCEKLREKIETHDWQQLAPGLRVTASFGLADDLGLPDFLSLLASADAKLYEAKRGGRNQVRF